MKIDEDQGSEIAFMQYATDAGIELIRKLRDDGFNGSMSRHATNIEKAVANIICHLQLHMSNRVRDTESASIRRGKRRNENPALECESD